MGREQIELFDIREPLKATSQGLIEVGGKVVASPGSNRDETCGMCLRGTAYLPGTPWLAVARMSAGGGLSVVDTNTRKVLRDWSALPATPRHLQVWQNWLYLSANVSGQVARIELSDLAESVMTGTLPKFQARKVGYGARTLKVTDKGVFVALNDSRKVAWLSHDLKTTKNWTAPSFPVGLDVYGATLAVTSQGHRCVGGHRLWLYDLNRLLRDND